MGLNRDSYTGVIIDLLNSLS